MLNTKLIERAKKCVDKIEETGDSIENKNHKHIVDQTKQVIIELIEEVHLQEKTIDTICKEEAADD